MFDTDRANEIYQTLSKNKLRTTLTAFGVFWGIFMLIIMLGAGNGLQNGVLSSFGGSAVNAVNFWTQQTTMPYKGLPANRGYIFENEDIVAIRAQVPEIEILAPNNRLGGWRGESNVVRKNKTAPFTVRGDYPEMKIVQNLNMASGRFINNNDIAERRKVCAIGVQVRDVLFSKDENPIGDYIQTNGIYFKVIGVVRVDKDGEDAQDMMQTIYTPFTTFQQAFNWGNRVGSIVLTARKDVPASVAEDKVKAVLQARHKIHPDDKRAVGSWNAQKDYEKLTGLFAGIQMLVWVVGIGTLAAGVIGVSNIMLIIVKERTKEIGIRRAIGATPFSIISQILAESVVLTSLAGYLGLVSGILLLEGIDILLRDAHTTMFQHPGVDISIALKALLILVFCGALAGIIPARKAVAISPVDALRDE